MRKHFLLLLAAALWVALWAESRAQGIDPGIAAIVLGPLKTHTHSRNHRAGVSNGWTPFLDNAQGTTVTTVKSSAGELGAYHCLNPNSRPPMFSSSTPPASDAG